MHHNKANITEEKSFCNATNRKKKRLDGLVNKHKRFSSNKKPLVFKIYLFDEFTHFAINTDNVHSV